MPRSFSVIRRSIHPRAYLQAQGVESLRASDVILGTVAALAAVLMAAMLLSQLFASA